MTFIVDAYERGDVQIYIDGAQAPVQYNADRNVTYTIRQTLVDLGEGVRQYVRLYDPDTVFSPCFFSDDTWVDVVPGKLIDAGRLYFDFVQDYVCPRMFSSSWTYDGNHILYMRRDPTTDISPENNIWYIESFAASSTIGTRILNWNDFATTEKIYRAVLAPTVERANELLILQNSTLQDVIYHTTTDNPNNLTRIDIGLCPTTTCDLLDIAWLPDGSGFVISRFESGQFVTNSGVLYRYSFDTGDLKEILRLPNEIIGKVSVSPDGDSIAIERGTALTATVDSVYWGPSLQCPCQIWVVDIDGSKFHQLTADGRAPAWGQIVYPGI